jgi:hypothetical protein
MCSGGGGGGDDGGAAKREEERQARIAAGTEAVNALFGVGERTALVPTGEKSLTGYKSKAGAMIDPAAYEAMKKSFNPEMAMVNLGSAQDNYTAYSPVFRSATEGSTTTIGQNADARAKLYDTIKGDTRNYFSSQLEEDRAAARRALDFQKARAGTAGSSQGIDLDTEFQKRYDRGLLEIGNRSDSAYSGMKTADEQARLGLISKIVSGVDQGSAVSSALSQMQSNLENSRNEAMTGRMANVFADLIGGYNNGQTIAGQNAAKQQFGSSLGNYIPASGNNGSVQRT